jgi:DNA-directed RNA polymerase specialized sigma24 family protein
MRGLVIDYVRQRQARKRGGDLSFTTLGEDGDGKVGAGEAMDFDALGAALEVLAEIDPGLAELVDLKFFCGFSCLEIATLRSASERTVQRDWAKARALLHRFISADS